MYVSEERECEEGSAATDTERQEDPLNEYREKEGMTPAKIKEHEPTVIKRERKNNRPYVEGPGNGDTWAAQGNEPVTSAGGGDSW